MEQIKGWSLAVSSLRLTLDFSWNSRASNKQQSVFTLLTSTWFGKLTELPDYYRYPTSSIGYYLYPCLTLVEVNEGIINEVKNEKHIKLFSCNVSLEVSWYQWICHHTCCLAYISKFIDPAAVLMSFVQDIVHLCHTKSQVNEIGIWQEFIPWYSYSVPNDRLANIHRSSKHEEFQELCHDFEIHNCATSMEVHS